MIPTDAGAGRRVARHSVGDERQPLAVVDGFAADPDALRAAAMAAAFAPAGQHYPGLRAPLPPDYLRQHLPVIAEAMGRAFGRFRRLHVIDASFSIVTTPPDALHPRQRLPHVDAYGAERIALVHYLSPTAVDGTAFYRHRATGYETVDAARAPGFFATLDDELAADPPVAAYIAGDTAQFACIDRVAAAYNRAVVYRSFALHSGAIGPGATLSVDPATGRLTITGFLAME